MKIVLVPLSLSLLCLAAASGTARAQVNDVTFIEGSYTDICEYAARNIGEPIRTALTGTRLDLPAVDLCTLAIREDASTYNRASNHNNRGVLLFAEGRHAEALRDFERAVRLRDRLASGHVNLGLTLVAMERWDEALAALDRGIALKAEETATAEETAPTEESMAGGKESGSQRAIEIEEAARAHFNRAIAHEELGHLREAYQDYRRAAELAPEWEAPRLELTRFRVGGRED